ncbi:VanW family protein [Candidatus Uhrbacteria bacterium]|nr:VanW family protein [Candidatus Uhrbacteria bacterium]
MTSPAPDHETSLSALSGGFWNTRRLLFVVCLVLLSGLFSGTFVWARGYEGRIPPRSFVGEVDMSGLDPETALQKLQSLSDALIASGIEIRLGDTQATLPLSTDVAQLVEFDLDATIEELMANHSDQPLLDTMNMSLRLLRKGHAAIDVALQKELIQSTVRSLFPDAETLSVPTLFSISAQQDSPEPWSITVVPGAHGEEFVFEPFLQNLQRNLATLSNTTLTLTVQSVDPDVSEQEASLQIEQAQRALEAAPFTITSQDQTWELDTNTLASMLTPGTLGQLSLNQDLFDAWASTMIEAVAVPVQDARIVIANARVSEFVESHEGIDVHVQTLFEDLVKAVRREAPAQIALTTSIIEPSVKTADVNDLGIDEILGVGTSSYRGSPTNRRGNIQNGVNLLNGLLIPPGETFSLLSALSPFTIENGYLPELVIKGDKITPEIGGGLCQIGTTTFRATMKSGLPVIERQNHSLVVSYYNDPSNGNPGTDATIYEPAPDFKFINDTGNYILFQAENLIDLQELHFTFWGTSDGRVGSYTPPVVERWIPVPEKQIVETTDLEPGVEQCQNAHIGADASFTYTITRPDTSIEETVFTSHYRPLPEICLVGVEELTKEDVDPGLKTTP